MKPHQSVPVDPLALVHPKVHELFGRFELIRLGHEQSLEHVTEMPNVELVVKVRCSLSEIRSNLFDGSRRGLVDVVVYPTV